MVVEHEPAAAAMADRIVLLRDGELVASGTPGELLPQVALFKECGVRPHDIAHVFQRLCPDADQEARWLQLVNASDPPAAAHRVLVSAGFAAEIEVLLDSPTECSLLGQGHHRRYVCLPQDHRHC